MAARFAVPLLLGALFAGVAPAAVAGNSRPPLLVRGRAPVVAVAGDIACDPRDGNFRGHGSPLRCRDIATSNLVRHGHYRAVIALGDLQYRTGRLWQFRRSYDRTWGRFKRRTIPVPGNHEFATRDGRGYFNYFNGRGRKTGPAGPRGLGWYSTEVGRWHVVVLNSNCEKVGCGPQSPQLVWLRRNLILHPSRCVLAAFHHPRYSSGVHEEDEDVSTIWRTLYRAGVDVVLNGHDHDYERFAPQGTGARLDRRRGVVEFVVGTGGHSQFRLGPRLAANSRAHSDDTFGILGLRLAPGRYRWAFRASPSGRVLDSGHRRCTPLGPLVRGHSRP